LKTFWTGIGGWADKQLPDGTVVWTAPSGRTYTTKPGGALFFPILATPTGTLPIRTTEPAEYRGVMMPRRKRTRAQEQRNRINAERRISETRIAEERQQYEAWLAATYEPPPFQDVRRCRAPWETPQIRYVFGHGPLSGQQCTARISDLGGFLAGRCSFGRCRTR
jgi:hypothetical protein